MIRTNDFRAQWAEIGAEAAAVFAEVGASGWYILGREVEAFEAALATAWCLPHAVGVGNGLDALEIALRALELRPGDRVLTTPLSAFATTLAIVRAGGVPVFVDVDRCGLLDLDAAESALRGDPSIRCLLPVHLYGHALDLERLDRLRSEYGVRLVEDAAQAIGARWGGRPVGSAGELTATSFYPTKNLGALGDGGAVLTADAELAARARALRHYGQSSTYVHDRLGANSRLDELHAALLGRVLLPRLERWTARRRAIATHYLAELGHPEIELPEPAEGSESVWHLFPVVAPAGRRDALREHLRRSGVESGVHYPRLAPEQRALEGVPHEVLGELRGARRFADGEVSLPIHPFLDDAEVGRVIEAVASWEAAC